jgi:hypothetical protein
MTTPLNLKEIERKAFRSTYQDGLLDIYLGLATIAIAAFIYHPAGGYSPRNILLLVLSYSLAYSMFWAGKKYLTLPRMGLVRFGAARRRRKLYLAIAGGALVLVQLGVLGLTTLGWLDPALAGQINASLQGRDLMDLAVAGIGALFVGVGMLMMAYFTDFSRGFYISLLMALAVFLMIYLNQPLYPVLIGMLILLPGLALLVRFLKAYPRPPAGALHG